MKRIKSLKDIKNVNLIFEIIINTIFLCHFKKARTKDSFAFFFSSYFSVPLFGIGLCFPSHLIFCYFSNSIIVRRRRRRTKIVENPRSEMNISFPYLFQCVCVLNNSFIFFFNSLCRKKLSVLCVRSSCSWNYYLEDEQEKKINRKKHRNIKILLFVS